MPETETSNRSSELVRSHGPGQVSAPRSSMLTNVRAGVPALRQFGQIVQDVVPRSRLGLSFFLVVIAPLLLASIYLLGWASERYVSEFRVAVRALEPLKIGTGGLGDLLGMAGASRSGNDSYAVVQYIQSREAFNELSRKHPVQAHYNDRGIDWFSRLANESPVEKFERYWNDRVTAHFEPTTGTVIVKVTAFDPKSAFDFASGLHAQAETLVNQLSAKARRDSVSFAEQEVNKAELRLSDLRKRLTQLQDKERLLDPLKAAESTLMLAAKIKEEIARLRASLITQRVQLGPDAPSVRATLNHLSGLEQELKRIEAQLTNTGDVSQFSGKSLSTSYGEFSQLAEEKGFSEKAYLSALASLETARMDADRKQIYLATIVKPGLPEEPVFPRPPRNLFLVASVAFCFWLLGVLFVHTIREHM